METFPPVLRHSDLIDLSDDGAVDGSLVGAKAANLARARRAGLPVLPGVVLTTDWDHRGWSHPSRAEHSPARAAWETLGESGGRTVVVRSSSTNEDGGSSSMAGVFESVLDVSTLAELRRRRRPGARVAAQGRRARRSHGRPDPAPARAAVRRGAVRRRPGVGPHRPPAPGRRRGRTRPPGQRPRRRLDRRSLAPRQGPRGARWRRPPPRAIDAAGAGRPGRTGHRRLRRSAGHRVGRRPRRHGVDAAEPPDHHADRPTRGPGARHRSAGGDLPRAPRHPGIGSVAGPARARASSRPCS